MSQRWYQKASVQAAMVAGGAAVIVALMQLANSKSSAPTAVDSPAAVIQNMQDSPGGVQVGGDVNIDTDRRLTGAAADKLIARLKGTGCRITVGVLGTGGEPVSLANDFLSVAQKAGCEAEGVYSGVGFPAFDGIQLRYAVPETPTRTLEGLITTLKETGFAFVAVPDPSKSPGSVYVYVGFKPSPAG